MPTANIGSILYNLEKEIDRLIRLGVTTFISGGAVGFEQIAASLVIIKKETGFPVRLILAVPYRGEEASWSMRERRLFRNLMNDADDAVYLSKTYSKKCMDKRNRYLVDNSAHCICAMLDENGEVGRTVQYAHIQNIQVINVASR